MDASVLVSLFLNDTLSQRADDFVRRTQPEPIVSDFAATEFSSVVSRRVRTGENSASEAQLAFQAFDQWLETTAVRVECDTADLRQAERFLRRLDLTLRAPDAIHIAIAQRLNLELATFDERMAECASRLGVRLAAA
jgi:hypothetical protein